MINQTLLDELLRIQEALDEVNIPFLLGGGMGLYLRDLYPTGRRQQAYRYRIASRTTKDLDVFLSAEVIADADRMNRLHP